MTATDSKLQAAPLDLARYERSHAHEICLNYEAGEGLTALSPMFGRADEQYAALLAECISLRAELLEAQEIANARSGPIKALREALEGLLNLGPAEGDYFMWEPLEKQARAALAKVT